MELIVSLPDNTPEHALAAQRGGADSVKLHLNVNHRASGTSFGGFAKERPRIQAVLDEVTLTVGLMPGADRIPEPAEMTELSEMGISFIDIYFQNMPMWLARFPSFNKIPAFDFQSAENAAYQVSLLNQRDIADMTMLELSLVHPNEYGSPLTLADVARYRSFIDASGLPVIVPTQKRITPDDVETLGRIGCAGLMIGSVVTGNDPEGVESTTAEFRSAIDALE